MDKFENAKSLFFAGLDYFDANKLDDALDKFLAAEELVPGRLSVLNNLAAVLIKLKRHEEAMLYVDRALVVNPLDVVACGKSAYLTAYLGTPNKALEAIEKSLILDPENPELWVYKAFVFSELLDYSASIQAYEKAVFLGHPKEQIIGELNFSKLSICQWTDIERDFKSIRDLNLKGSGNINPFQYLSLPSNFEEQLQTARRFSASIKSRKTRKKSHGPTIRKERIHVGYFCSEFRQHPLSHLMIGSFREHDRDCFNITAFSFGRHQADEMRRRLENTFDQFLDVSQMQASQVHQLMLDLDIDIAVDLNGHTSNNLTAIFAPHIAPVQINMVGYPGSMGLDCYDYILGDETITPIEQARHIEEKIAFMPGSYLPYDDALEIYKGKIDRASQNLPPDAFVFCGFNAMYKITPDLFSIWMKLLKNVDSSVLWLRGQSDEAMANLKLEALEHGVEPDRLVFAGIEPIDKHIARHSLADLFLDCFYCNAHTTGSDALFTGLPILTCCGNSFPSRVGASLVRAAGIPQMAVDSYEEYYEMAYFLATHPDKLAQIRQQLVGGLSSCKLFDTSGYTRDLEQIYSQMMERVWAGLAPDHITIANK